MKRNTTRHHRNARHNVLQVRVFSPRIAWLGALRITATMAKTAGVLAAVAGIGWAGWHGIQHAFHSNPDFRLQVLDLNPNPVIDEVGAAATAGIDLAARPSLFDIDVKEATARLKALPAISEARVERHLPGTLVIRVIPRAPKAWIACPAAGIAPRRAAGDLLVDPQGFTYPCPPLQEESAASLPIVELPEVAGQTIQPGARLTQPELERCFLLLDSARRADPQATGWIERIRQINDWSLLLVTRQGTEATFSLGDHPRQIERLRAALEHAGEKGYTIATINLIPKYNVPITVRDTTPPKAIPVSGGGSRTVPVTNRRARDLNHLLNRN